MHNSYSFQSKEGTHFAGCKTKASTTYTEIHNQLEHLRTEEHTQTTASRVRKTFSSPIENNPSNIYPSTAASQGVLGLP